MGTNFYWIRGVRKKLLNLDIDESGERESIQIHVGKHSAAGKYCWDCGTTLCKEGTQYIHTDNAHWFDTCPICNKSTEKDVSEIPETTEIQTCSSFIWSLMIYLKHIKQINVSLYRGKIIIDEYGEKYSAGKFLKMLEFCPIQFQLPVRFS